MSHRYSYYWPKLVDFGTWEKIHQRPRKIDFSALDAERGFEYRVQSDKAGSKRLEVVQKFLC
jgi:hypothetical protein